MALPVTENRSTARWAGVKPGVFGKTFVKGLAVVEKLIRGRDIGVMLSANKNY